MYLTQGFHRALQQQPDRLATVCGDRRRTVAEVGDRVARFAGALKGLGVAPGDRVAILARNADVYHEYLLAVPWADAVLNTINTRWTPDEIRYAVQDSGTVVLLFDDGFREVALELLAAAPSLRTVVSIGDSPVPDGAVGYEDLIATARPCDDARRGGEELAGLYYTGGTTGLPKGVMLTHDNIGTSALGTLAGMALPPEGLRYLHAAPMFHIADFVGWTLVETFGGTHVFVGAFDPVTVLETIATERVTHTLIVPTMIQLLVDHPDLASFDLSSLASVMYGASPMPPALLERAMAALPGATFTQMYGMTELSPVTTILGPSAHHDPALRSSAGRPAPHAEVRIVDAAGQECARGEVGEVIARGGHVMSGYWNKPEETAAAVRDGWMHTGDGGYMDEAGNVFIVDRIKDMIVTGGENVYSVEVESAIVQMPAVAACAVIGLPDDRWIERVHAVVVLQPGHAVTADEIIEHARTRIAAYKVPRSVEIVDQLPVSGAGKVLKHELRAARRARTHPNGGQT